MQAPGKDVRIWKTVEFCDEMEPGIKKPALVAETPGTDSKTNSIWVLPCGACTCGTGRARSGGLLPSCSRGADFDSILVIRKPATLTILTTGTAFTERFGSNARRRWRSISCGDISIRTKTLTGLFLRG
jgi:hypothetical protein